MADDLKLDVTLGDVAVLAVEVVEGATPEARLKAVAAFLDAVTPADKIPVIGGVAEELDGPFFEDALLWAHNTLKADPEKKKQRQTARQAKAKAKRAERRKRRPKKRRNAARKK